jgi:hypothetical protein
VSARVLVLAWAALGSACATSNFDRSPSSDARVQEDVPVSEVPVRGFPVELTMRAGDPIKGELLGLDELHAWVQGPYGVTAVHLGNVEKVSVEAHPSGAAAAGVWTGIGTASTLSHGFLLILTAPLWLAAGLTSTITMATGNDRESRDPAQFKRLAQYARFPQGMVKRLANCPDHPGGAEPAEQAPRGTLQL